MSKLGVRICSCKSRIFVGSSITYILPKGVSFFLDCYIKVDSLRSLFTVISSIYHLLMILWQGKLTRHRGAEQKVRIFFSCNVRIFSCSSLDTKVAGETARALS